MTSVNLRARAQRVVDSERFNQFIVAVILLNALTLGLECFPAIFAAYGPALKTIDHAFLAVFVVELVLKLVAQGAQFFRKPWNWFDATIVAASMVPNAGAWTVLRVLRLLRLFSASPALRKVVESLLRSLPGMGAIVAVLGVISYVAAVAATQLFGHDPDLAQRFGSLDRSAYTLFQVMTLDGWGEVSDETMVHFPHAWAFFLPFIVITSFAVLNLFIAVIVEGLGEQRDQREQKMAAATIEDLERLEAEMRLLRETVERSLQDRIKS